MMVCRNPRTSQKWLRALSDLEDAGIEMHFVPYH